MTDTPSYGELLTEVLWGKYDSETMWIWTELQIKTAAAVNDTLTRTSEENLGREKRRFLWWRRPWNTRINGDSAKEHQEVVRSMASCDLKRMLLGVDWWNGIAENIALIYEKDFWPTISPEQFSQMTVRDWIQQVEIPFLSDYQVTKLFQGIALGSKLAYLDLKVERETLYDMKIVDMIAMLRNGELINE